MMNKDTFRQILVVLATLATIGVNALASALPLNGQTTGEISDRFDVFFVPAGYVFSIWGLIYLGLLAYSVYQAAANIAWIFLWHYEFFPLSVVAMLTLLGLLIAIYLRLDIGRAKVAPAMKWLVHVPFSLYLGWITVATIANITSVLYFLEWNGWGISPEAWTLIMLAAAVAIGGAVSLTRGDVAYAAVLIWAFAGIAVKHEDTAIVATAAWLAAAVTAIFMIIGAYRHRQRGQNVALAT
jgi:hypothetical protein